MSGGVDSSVSAVLLKKQGYDVAGAFIVNWSDTKDIKGECAWKEERRDAIRVAARLDIPLHTFDFEKEYRKWVVDYMMKEYRRGRTPNPDILCNKFVKFGLFYRAAQKKGYNTIATGHYARIKKTKSQYQLLKGADKNKDQSYFLYSIDYPVLPHVLFPIGDINKTRVRKIAASENLPVSDKPDSTGICFVGKIDLEDFLKQKIKPKKGDIIDLNGRRIGRHNGIFYYTIGQRHGFGIKGGGDYYIVKKDVKNNLLIVARGRNNPALFSTHALAAELNWLGSIKLPLQCKVKIRYRQEDQDCHLSATSDKKSIMMIFKKPQWAVAPGQSAVFYKGERCLGGGVIQ